MATDPALRRQLLELARESIHSGLGSAAPLAPPGLEALPAALAAQGASFVTLSTAAGLRGCRGMIEAQGAVAHDVWRNAWSSAFDDPRFPPVAAAELDELRIAISLLSALQAIPAGSQASLIASIEPGRHGLVLSLGGQRATFLPQVWTSLPDPADFVAELRAKAGLPTHGWPARLQAWRYTVDSFSAEP